MSTTEDAMDLVDFLVQRASEPIPVDIFHSYFGHHELSFDRDAGRATVRREINELFRRNDVAYEIGSDFRTRRPVSIEGASQRARCVCSPAHRRYRPR